MPKAKVDPDTGRIEIASERFDDKRVARFLVELQRARKSRSGKVNQSQMIDALGIEAKSLRTIFSRIIARTERLPSVGENLRYEHKTTGPWWLNADVVEFPDGPDDQDHEETKGTWAKQNAAAFSFLPDFTLKLVNIDIAVETGDLANARELLDDVDDVLLTSSQKLALSVRSIRMALAAEDYDELNHQSRVLATLTRKLRDPIEVKYAELKLALAKAWHAYRRDEAYDLCDRRLCRIEMDVEDFSDLTIDWLNLKGLVERRLSLLCVEAGDFTAAKILANDSITRFHRQINLSVCFGSHFQVQRALANLANVHSVFLSLSVWDASERDRIVALSLSLLAVSEKVCRASDLGKDDIYTTVFALSLVRKNMAHQDSATRSKAVTSVFGSNSRVDFGIRKLSEAEKGLLLLAPEQRAFLAFEVAWAAVDEGEISEFQASFKMMIDASWQSRDVKKVDIPRRKRMLLDFANQKYAKSSRWKLAIAELSGIEVGEH